MRVSPCIPLFLLLSSAWPTNCKRDDIIKSEQKVRADGPDTGASTNADTIANLTTNHSTYASAGADPNARTSTQASVFQQRTVAAGYWHSIVVHNDGSVHTTGRNTYNQLGGGATDRRNEFVQVLASGGISASGGLHHTVVLKNDGSVHTVGYNVRGALGDGTTVDRNEFVQVVPSGAIGVATGNYHTMVLKNDGSVHGAGFNAHGQLGDGTNVDRHDFVQAVASGGVAIEASVSYTVLLKNDGSVHTAGENNYGQLGDGTRVSKNEFVQVVPSGAIAVSAGLHTVVLKNDGSVHTVGLNNAGQIGDGTKDTSGCKCKTDFVQVVASGGVAIAAGYSHTVVLKNDGSVHTVGQNSYGQLGDGTRVSKNDFVQVVPSGGIAASAGYLFTLLLKNDGSVHGAGYNGWGQLGDGANADRLEFEEVVPSGSGMVPSLPSPSPTPVPTTAMLSPSPTVSLTPSPTSSAMPSATGDPHLRNIHGERFDLTNPGRYVLINIPRGERGDRAMLRVQADAVRQGTNCGDLYFQALNVTGIWAEAKQKGGYHYSVSQNDATSSGWAEFGKVALKIVIGHTDRDVQYLNVFAKHLGQSGFAVGGLLGEDDHEEASTSPETCVKRVALVKGVGAASSPIRSVAEAILA